MDTTYLNHSIEEELIESLHQQILNKGKKYKAIYTSGRGGLSIAQRLAYKLNITEVSLKVFPPDKSDILYVDDISCTGHTLKSKGLRCDSATLIFRHTSSYKPTFFALEVKSANYIKFSWEN